MKVALKLKKFELWDLIDFIETTYPGQVSTPDEGLRKICLAEFLAKLKMTSVFVKADYRIVSSYAHLLALTNHALNADYPDPTVWITINRIISITGSKINIKAI